ncbi:MAG TPA: glucoamylase family protein [Bacteroidales bacterium]|nr:glucoamylase family protein [Bacteroidales bacterium]
MAKGSINESFQRLKSHLWENDLSQKYSGGEPPFRADLFSTSQMEQYGKVLAGQHVLGSSSLPDTQLLDRLAENEDLLLEVHQLVSSAVEAGRPITPAGEWLLDNFYLIEEQIRVGKRHLPKRYSKELPRLSNGASAGLPRVYDIAKEIIAHGDGYIDPKSLNRFVASYQTVSILNLGELWAIPIMLRLALIENLRRVAVRIAAGRIDRDLADSWADKMINISEKDPKNLILVLADMARSEPPMTSPFVSEFVRRLQGQNPALAFPLTWIEQRLVESNQTTIHLIESGTQQQAADQVSISNSIGSLRALSSLDWRNFVESLSVVENILLGDPAGVYGIMDFETRDHYRHVIEKIAKRGKLSESDVALKSIELAKKQASLHGQEDRKAHVGYFLISNGLRQIEELTGIKRRLTSSRFRLAFYIGSILCLTLLISYGLLMKASNDGMYLWRLWITAFLLFICVSHLSVAVVNWISSIITKPKLLPRLDYSEGIPPESKTLVVIPTIITSNRNIEDLIEALEVRFLANQDKNLHFGLLTDLADASHEKTDADEKLIMFAAGKIRHLNKKYPNESSDTFFLFHRPRKWNPVDKIWMGYERKRGKLADLNALLLLDEKRNFSNITGDTTVLRKIRYVITLDTDTQLPRDTARKLAGTMAHPLNRPKYDQKKQRVTEGYTILQPRIAVSLPGTNKSKYAKLFGSDPGIDPYTRAVSDVYQDLFGEGSFIGKGIYDIEFFEQSLKDKFPRNRILSHDLLEGCYARSGLLSDVLLFEDYPLHYETDVKRRSRWIRGDWQLIPWLFPVLPKINGSSRKNPLSLLSWWKILDNLRRSLVPLALLLLLIAGWTFLSSALFWTLTVIAIISAPSLITAIVYLSLKPDDVLMKSHLESSGKLVVQKLQQSAFSLLSIPYEASWCTHAILRTCYRLFISKKRLLEWNTKTEDDYKKTIAGSYLSMWFSPFIAIFLAVYLSLEFPKGYAIALPFIIAWSLFPAVSWWIGKVLIPAGAKLSVRQYRFLKDLSRKTWFFFETFVKAEDNWLPPDNFQEDPGSIIAHRTSPTNIGLSLLSNLAAFDFGYIFSGELLERIKNSFKTMSSMEKYHGHFFNWYDTKSLEPLRPLYISSVDSGNLAAHLITLKQGLLDLPDQPVTGLRLFEGINDTFTILVEKAGKKPDYPITGILNYLNEILSVPPTTLKASVDALARLRDMSAGIEKALTPKSDDDYRTWVSKFSLHCRNAFDELIHFTTWTTHQRFEEISQKYPILNSIPTFRGIAEYENQFSYPEKTGIDEELVKLIKTAVKSVNERIKLAHSLAEQADGFSVMQFDFLYDRSRRLQTIGYNVEDRRADQSFYDLLASEARLASFVAIAQDQVPQESWFALGRLLTNINGEPVLLSWSGSMFEYLMPLLVMPLYENSLLFQTCRAAVIRQMEYGDQRNVPWGISESGYNRVDAQKNYQYRAFGVPGIGLKRGLNEDLVIAPYATALALMILPEEACKNLQRLADEGNLGRFGFYEAIDYTPSRVPRGQSKFVIRSFMAHHQGMSFLSLSSVLLGRPMQRRFESNSLFQSALLLLQERTPRATTFYAHTSGVTNLRTSVGAIEKPLRVFETPDTQYPEIKMLANGRYRVLITNAGGGYSHWKDLALTRWREDVTSDNWGSFCYIRDVETGNFWSNTFQPTLWKPGRYEAIFSEGRAEFRRRDHDIDTYTGIAVSPEDDIELRRVKLTNRSRKSRIIDITSYAEVVLSSNDADLAHPAFSNLFVQTEIYHQRHAILCTRRPRSVHEEPPWMFHQMAVHGAEIRNITYETDRMKFIGRGNTLVSPDAMTVSTSLTNSQGSVLDPIVSIQFQIVLEAEGSATIDIITGITPKREEAIMLVEKYQDKLFSNRVFELAWTHSQVILQQINASESDAQLYGRLANSVIFANPSLRADSSILVKNRRGQSGLWGYSISGDLPIILLQIGDPANINLVRQLVQAHAYWRLKGLSVDLVIWNEDRAGYRQLLNDQIIGLIASGVEANVIDRPGGIFVRSADQISVEDRILFQTVARVTISDSKGTLAEQLKRRRSRWEIKKSYFKPTRNYKPVLQSDLIFPRNDLLFYNGVGGFTADGREYVITTSKKVKTPAPWVNVLANELFGTVVSERGTAYTWVENSHEYRLTPWHNDPVKDQGGEIIYIRDEETGHFWSPSPLSDNIAGIYVCRHGFGYSVFEHNEGGIVSELWVYVALNAAIKFSVLKITNKSGRPVRLSVTCYTEWVLGDMRHKTSMHIVTSSDPINGIIYAQNPYSSEFAGRTAFLQTDEPSFSFTCDRTEFIGRNGNLQNPDAMSRSGLSGKKGVGLDPCAVIQVTIDLMAGQDREVVFRLGSGRDQQDTDRLVKKFVGSAMARSSLEEVWKYWSETLGSVHVESPDLSLNVLANGWLLYQTLACRIWARSGFYQSGGAFGFRDQLQDAMALIHSQPRILRDFLLLFASRQFAEGDVQHWWHPPTGRGVRTHCSDDYLWLPLATSRYVSTTGDTGVLDETIYFLEGRPVNPEDDSYYDLPNRSDEAGSLYDHCKRSILYGLRFGEHGLPLIGTCDWNDGMNLIGHQGKGESVWLAFFLYEIISQFAILAEARGDLTFVETCRNTSQTLRSNIEKNAWDGKWYRRAYFDNGLPLGSSDNQECQIDSISQSWSVLSGAGSPERSQSAMDSVNERLVNNESSLVQLLDPPFDKSDLNPGYIKGYVPGVRENGGQYTHAAIWVAMAFARMGENEKAWDIFNLINPVNHASSSERMLKYKVEPYVVAADVYALSPHEGRGGWTWYTGSAGWMYRLIIESLLGLRLEVERLYIQPCLPPNWDFLKIRYRFRGTFYNILIRQSSDDTVKMKISLDGISQENFVILVDDHNEHYVDVSLLRQVLQL